MTKKRKGPSFPWLLQNIEIQMNNARTEINKRRAHLDYVTKAGHEQDNEEEQRQVMELIEQQISKVIQCSAEALKRFNDRQTLKPAKDKGKESDELMYHARVASPGNDVNLSSHHPNQYNLNQDTSYTRSGSIIPDSTSPSNPEQDEDKDNDNDNDNDDGEGLQTVEICTIFKDDGSTSQHPPVVHSYHKKAWDNKIDVEVKVIKKGSKPQPAEGEAVEELREEPEQMTDSEINRTKSKVSKTSIQIEWR